MEKLFITLITCEWILPSVYSLIIYKSSSFRINLSTLFTWKWFLSSMYCLLLELRRPNSGRPNSGRPNSGHPNRYIDPDNELWQPKPENRLCDPRNTMVIGHICSFTKQLNDAKQIDCCGHKLQILRHRLFVVRGYHSLFI